MLGIFTKTAETLRTSNPEFSMSGPQFVHLQTWSRKPNKAGQSVDQVIDEATRDPEFSTHVENPAPVRPLYGDPSTFKADHAAHVAARSTVAVLKDGSEKRRSIRTDRHTMASIVMSYPVPRSAITTDEAREKLVAWEKRNLDWLQEKYGAQLRVVLAHDDESHPHLHAWLLPDNDDADATMLHPGKVAKKEVEAGCKQDGMQPREAVKLGNRALKEAMTAWQDEYHQLVGVPEGLTRSGPKRRRLSREQWKAEKATAKAMQLAMERAEAAEARVLVIEERERKIQAEVATLKKVNASLSRGKEKLEAREDAVAVRERAIEVKERQSENGAARIIEAAQTEAQAITEQAETLRAETHAECVTMVDKAHGERRKIIRFMKRVSDIVVRIGSALGRDLLGKDLMRDIEDIEDALSAAENSRPKADGDDGPGF